MQVNKSFVKVVSDLKETSLFLGNMSTGTIIYDRGSGLSMIIGKDGRKYYFIPTSGYGYVCGGYLASDTGFFSTIDRFSFPFYSGSVTVVGSLSVSLGGAAGANSSVYGYVCGGYSGSYLSMINRFQFPFDSGGETEIIGNLTNSVGNLSGNNSSTYGYVCSGSNGSSLFSLVSRFQFSFDYSGASVCGTLTASKHLTCANNSSSYGYVCGGSLVLNNSVATSIIDRFTFPFDSGTATAVGNMAAVKFWCSANNSSVHGYIYGGAGSDLSTINRFGFPFDSGTSICLGNLPYNAAATFANNSSAHGYVCGGGTSSASSVINYLSFLFDSGTAAQVGNLSIARGGGAAVDTTDFVRIFV